MTIDWFHTKAKVLDVSEHEATRKSSQGEEARRLSPSDLRFRISAVSGISSKQIQMEEMKRCQELNKKRIQEHKQRRAEASKDTKTVTKLQPRDFAKFIKATRKALVL
jgi:TolA-binding protein